MLNRAIWAVLAISACGMMQGCAHTTTRDMPIAEDGVIDLRGWNFETDGPVELKGEWNFWFQQFLPNETFIPGQPELPAPLLYKVPQSLANVTSTTHESGYLPKHGYGTATLILLLPQNLKPTLGIAGQINWAMRLGIVGPHGKTHLGEFGRLGKDIDTSDIKLDYGSTILPLEQHITRHYDEVMLTLVVQLSSFHHPRGGLTDIFLLGPIAMLTEQTQHMLVRDACLIGLLLMMGLYHLGLVTQRPEDKSSLWFGTACLFITARLFFTSPLAPLLIDIQTTAESIRILRLEYLALASGVLMALFISSLVPSDWYKRFSYTLVLCHLPLWFLYVVADSNTFTEYVIVQQVLIIIMMAATCTHLIVFSIKGNSDARASLLGLIPLVLAAINDMLVNALLVTTPFLGPYGFGLFIFAQSYVLAKRFSQAHRIAENLTEHLQEEVDKQTSALSEQTKAAHLAHQASIELNAYLTNILESMTDSVIILDLEYRVKSVNQVFLNLSNLKEDDLVGKAFVDILDTSDILTLTGPENFFHGGLMSSTNVAFAAHDGTDITLTASGAVVKDHQGSPSGYVICAHDERERLRLMAIESQAAVEQHKRAAELETLLDELRHTQSQLVQAEKMSSLGELVAGVAHELNNPLNFIRTNSALTQKSATDIRDTLMQMLKGNPEASGLVNYLEEEFHKIEQATQSQEEGIERSRTIINSLLNFSRQSIDQLERVEVQNIIANAVTILGKRIKDVQFETQGDDTMLLQCNANEICQVLMNLVSNATYQVQKVKPDDGPKVGIRTERIQTSACIEVWDNGGGVPEELTDKIFNPFVTTKPVGEGTGMGLSVSYKIIDNHGGSLSCYNSDIGAVFKIVLPIAPMTGA